MPAVISHRCVSDTCTSVISSARLDRLGRRFTLLLCVLATAVFSIGGAFSTNYGTFAALRFLVAVFQYPLFTAPFVLSELLAATRL